MVASPHSYLTLTVWIAVLPVAPAFLVSPSLQRPSFGGYSGTTTTATTHQWQDKSPQCWSRLCMSSVTESTDPFQLLNIGPSADKHEIKRAYKRMALTYHPDVVTNQDTPPEQKKRANDVFAKINWAYAHLSAKDGGTSSTSSSTSTSSTSTTATTTSSSSPGTPHPAHRQTSKTPYNYHPNQASTDWRDITPKYEKQNQAYNAGGDDFDKKLEDLFNGAAASGGSGDVFRDFDNFLQVNGEGYSSREEEDAQLQMFLKTASVEQVGMKLEEQELVVRQLERQGERVADEVRQGRGKIASTNLYLEKKEWEKRVADLEARKHLFDGYLQEAHRRLSALQARHEQLVMIGEIHGYARGHARSSSRSSPTSFSHSAAPSANRGTSNNASAASSSSSSTSPPPRQEYPVTPPPPCRTSTPRPQSSTTRRGAYSNGSTASSPSSSSTSISEKDAWIHEEFGSNYRDRSRDTRSTASSSQRQPYSVYTPTPHPRQESSRTSGTYRDGSTFHYRTTPNTREQPLEDDAGAQSGWTIRLRDSVTGDDTLSLTEKEILKAATWVFEFSFRQRAHCIASRMLDEHLRNPAGDEGSPPVPNPENPAEAVALKLVEFAPSGERKQTRMDEKSRASVNEAPLGKNVDTKRNGSKGPFLSNFTQTVSTQASEQQTDDETKPVMDYEKAEASSLQNQHGKLDQGSMEKLAGYTDGEGSPRSLNLFHEETMKEDGDKVLSTKSHVDPLLSTTHASNRMEGIAITKKEKVKAKKRVVWLTRHIRILEAHKTSLPTGYFKAKNCRGNVLGCLCGIFSIPAKKKDGTTNRAKDKRLAIEKELGEKNPRRVFDNALEDLKQQLVSERITAA